MTSTTKNTFVEAVEEVANKVASTAKDMKCKPSHDKQREQIGGGYLICSTCSEEIPNK